MTTNHPIKSPRKLIEVALPLDAINVAAAKEKSIRFGHPSALHLWWARRPLAAARAVIFAQLVNDPGYQQGGGFRYGKNKKEAAEERKRLFKIIEDLVKWENTTNEEVLERARAEIRRSWREVCELNKDHPQAAELFSPDKMPGLHDPFAGGGAIPIEAQRLGIATYASDLNPVAVLINKAMIEIPPKFAGRAPVGPAPKNSDELFKTSEWPGATGLAEDVRRYGAWMREEAQKRIGHLYPQVEITAKMAKEHSGLKGLVGQKLTVIAWLWTRTVQCPNPGCGMTMPLLSSFILSSKKGQEVFLVPKVQGKHISFSVSDKAPMGLDACSQGYKRGMSGIFECPSCGTVTSRDYTAEFANSNGLGSQPIAIVCQGVGGRHYLAAEHGPVPRKLPKVDTAGLDIQLAPNPRDVWCRNFGLMRPMDLFTPRQLVALTTYCSLVVEVQKRILKDAIAVGLHDGDGLGAGGVGAKAYAEAVCVYLALAVSKLADCQSSLCRWKPSMDQSISTFGRQALPMVWDYSEANLFSEMAGDFGTTLKNMMRVLDDYKHMGAGGLAMQADAQTQKISVGRIISTDPPYYDNIGYADLSDYFYVWLRRTLRNIYPDLFATMAVPKSEELVAIAYRHGNREKAEAYFLNGMTQAMRGLAQQAHPAYPVTIYYAFKQSETESDSGTSSTGWETFLEAVNRSGLQLSGTWPMRTELGNRMISAGTNALASSIVLVCRQRPSDAATISRREFLRELNQVLPEALDEMTRGSAGDQSPVAPVDLSQAIIGPGMAVFSKYAAVLEADGSAMSVRTALQLINRFLAEDDFDPDTQFCLHWFEQNGWKEGAYGSADVLARAKATSVSGVVESGVVHSGGGKVRLVKFGDYSADWDPEKDKRLPVWEVLHHLIRALKQDGERAAGRLLAAVNAKGEAARQLAYRLYTLCERQGWAEDARAYNELITSWTAIEAAASEVQVKEQPTLFGETR